jgi:hypothetical protein
MISIFSQGGVKGSRKNFFFQHSHLLHLTPAIHHLADQMLNATMESVLACQSTRETPMLGVVLNVSLVLTVHGTELVSETNVPILVLALVVKEPHVM